MLHFCEHRSNAVREALAKAGILSGVLLVVTAISACPSESSGTSDTRGLEDVEPDDCCLVDCLGSCSTLLQSCYECLSDCDCDGGSCEDGNTCGSVE